MDNARNGQMLEGQNMEKEPKTCKKSINFDGVYLCRLELLPCAMVEKCALEKIDDMVNAASSFISARRKKPKKAVEIVDKEERHEDV